MHRIFFLFYCNYFQYSTSKHDVNTGYHILGAVYDADPENYITSGGFWTKLQKIVLESPETHSHSMLGFLTNTIRHINAHVFLQPNVVGMRGLLLKLSPSTEIPVTHLDLSLRLNQEMQRDEKLFTPKMSMNSRATYSVKNMDRAVRSWDMNVNTEMDSGHTNNNMKLILTRMVPGQKDYKICVDANMRYGIENVTGHVGVATSQSTDSKCTPEETMLDITVVGNKNKEQHKDHVVYGVCSYPQNKFLEADYTLPCIAAGSTLREYVYDVKTMNVPSEFKKSAMHWMDYLKGMYMSHYTHVPEHQEEVGENDLKIKVEYPVVGHQMNVEVVSHQQAWKLESMQVPDMPLLRCWAHPESTHVSDLMLFMHSVGLMDVCKIHTNDVHHHHHTEMKHVTNDWELYWGDKVQSPYIGVYIKKVQDKLVSLKPFFIKIPV